MKSRYMQTFDSVRRDVDKKIDNYFYDALFGEEESAIKRKYEAWLTLYEKEDSPDSKAEFSEWMQHEMQHEK